MAENPVSNTQLLVALNQAGSIRGAGRLLGLNQTIYYERAKRFPEVREALERLKPPKDSFRWRGRTGYVYQWTAEHASPRPGVRVGQWVAGMWIHQTKSEAIGNTKRSAVEKCRRQLDKKMLARKRKGGSEHVRVL